MNVSKPSPVQILKMLIGLLSLILILFISSSSYGQGSKSEPLKNKKDNTRFKIYSNLGLAKEINTSRLNTTVLTTLSDMYNVRPVGYFTPAFTIENRKFNMHEFELSRIVLRSTESEIINDDLTPGLEGVVPMQKTSDVFIAMRYEYGLMIGKIKRRYTSRPYIGFAFTPFLANKKITPLESKEEETSETSFGSTFSIVPRVTFNLKNKFFLDLNVPITMAQIEVSQFKGDDRPHKSKTQYSTLPGVMEFRVGLGIRL